MTFKLPADCSNTDARKRTKEVDKNRELYGWTTDYLKGISLLLIDDSTRGAEDEPGMVPLHEKMLDDKQQAALHETIAASDEDASHDDMSASFMEHKDAEGDEETRGLFTDYDSLSGVPKQEVPPLLSYILPRGLDSASSAKKREANEKAITSLSGVDDYQRFQNGYPDYDRLGGFKQVPEMYADDGVFGWERIAGTNPRSLRRVEDLAAFQAKMPVTDEMLAHVAPGRTLAAEQAAGRLFFCDYKILVGLERQSGRYMPPAIGLFWSDVDNNALRPVGIQLTQEPGTIHQPGDDQWLVAKTLFNVADFNYHEMGVHLGAAHFAQETFLVATRRALPEEHPIGALLYEVFWTLVYNNALGRSTLVNPGGYVDVMMAGRLVEGSLALVEKFYAEDWSFDNWDLEYFLGERGTLETKGLPTYPYRDDGLDMWGAIKTWATAYVEAWYTGDAAVAADTDIQNWVKECTSPDAGNLGIKGFPTQCDDIPTLAAILAKLIWQAGPGHGGINFSQYQYFSYIPNAPGAGYALEGDIMDVLPGIGPSLYQADILNLLTYKVFGRIGEYDKDFVKGLNDKANAAMINFQQDLKQVAGKIDARNSSGPRKLLVYPFLHPDQTPNSTNI
jgi:arachidonate 15-lipoxygenase